MNIILPDGKSMTLQPGETGLDVANKISPSLAKRVLAYMLDGQLYDLYWPIPKPGSFRLITEKDPEALTMLRHDASHLLAQAITQLYPGTKFGVGPAIDEGFYYDMDLPQPISEADFPKIEATMIALAKQAFPIRRKELSQADALAFFKDDPYKTEMIQALTGTISLYSQGDFTDLCLGPHFSNTSYNQHVKLLTTAGAYWRGDSKNKQLTRIYGTAFFSKKELDVYVVMVEERKKRDHRKLGKELGLFMMSDFGPGFPFWLNKGMILRKTLENFWIDVHRASGYQLVQTPTMLAKELWETSGHWVNYRENMYTSEIDDKEFAIKPMNCPGSMLVYKNEFYSYKDLPIRMAELGSVHRHEASGALSGLFRVRNFTQDDAHIYCTPDQLTSEVKAIVQLFDFFYKDVFKLEYDVYLSTRPEDKYIGSIDTWDASEKALSDALHAMGKPFKVNPGDGAFYGPKLDFKLKDSVGRTWQCGTVQLDMNNPERFDLTYINDRNEKVRPVMLHRVVYGSLERFIGILIEHYAGAFPTWLAPVQIKILPVNNAFHTAYTQQFKRAAEALGLRVEVDASEEKLGYRIRQAQMEKIPYSVVLGDKERDEQLVTYRPYGSETQTTVAMTSFLDLVLKEVKAVTELRIPSIDNL
jgi:threonyl-tRNA synthetase